jgi:predicted RNA binding protein YcfA (HicA-like mRNA interferase family)
LGPGIGELSNISGKEAVKAFERAGWAVRGQVGSHVMMTKEGVRVNLSVPQHKELSVGTLRKLIRVARLGVEEYLKLL